MVNEIVQSVVEETALEIGQIDISKMDFAEGKTFSVTKKDGEITVHYTKKSEIARALLIIKTNEKLQEYCIEERRDFEEVSLLLDCSRNAVRNIETVKSLIRNLAMLGYDSLMLYTEDTYEIEEEPTFGYLRGRYTKAEMKELDTYAKSLGIELIPSIQTLAHLNQLTRYKYNTFECFDCSDILMVGAERTYALIENMLKTVSECFTTRRVHIGMDEAWLLGRGKYLNVNGYKNSFDIILEHLYKVCEIAEKYAMKPIIWSDMFWRSCEHDPACKNEKGELVIPQRVLDKIPENLTMCHWEYNHLTPDGYEEKLKIHTRFHNPVWFAGGTAWGNRGILPHLTYSFKVSKSAIEIAKKYNVKTLLETVWGDNGGECSVFALLPAIAHYSYTARGVSENRLKNEFCALTGYPFDEFTKIEDAQTFCGKYTDDVCNPAKYGLYNDVLLGYLDTVINPEDSIYFSRAKSAVSKLKKQGKYAYLFETAYALNDVLSIKYPLGVYLRQAYAEQNIEKLKKCAEDLKKIISKVTKLIQAYRIQWYTENKPSGFEIQEIRLGGLKERLKGCLERVENYIDGKIDSLPELQEKLIPQAVKRDFKNGRCDEFSHEAIASVNAFDGFTEVDV